MPLKKIQLDNKYPSLLQSLNIFISKISQDFYFEHLWLYSNTYHISANICPDNNSFLKVKYDENFI